MMAMPHIDSLKRMSSAIDSSLKRTNSGIVLDAMRGVEEMTNQRQESVSLLLDRLVLISKIQAVYRGSRLRRQLHAEAVKAMNATGELHPMPGTERGGSGWYQNSRAVFHFEKVAADGLFKMTGEPMTELEWRQLRAREAAKISNPPAAAAAVKVSNLPVDDKTLNNSAELDPEKSLWEEMVKTKYDSRWRKKQIKNLVKTLGTTALPHIQTTTGGQKRRRRRPKKRFAESSQFSLPAVGDPNKGSMRPVESKSEDGSNHADTKEHKHRPTEQTSEGDRLGELLVRLEGEILRAQQTMKARAPRSKQTSLNRPLSPNVRRHKRRKRPRPRKMTKHKHKQHSSN